MSKRILSVILLICMLVNNLPVAAFAEGTDSGCNHVCDENCGYVKAVDCDKDCQPAEEGGEIVHDGCAFNAGSPCSHKHNGGCGVACTHAYSQGICSVCGAVCEHSYNTEGTCSVCGMAKPQPVCDCEVKCAENVNAACDFCGIDGADLTQCIGKEPKVECDCESKCTAENRNSDCPVCSADGADLTNCIGQKPETEAPVVTVSEWEWVDQEGIYNTDHAVAELVMAGPWEDVKALLPAAILVNGEEVVLTWEKGDFAEIPGTYTLTATLPEGYVLADGSTTLTLTLEMGVDSQIYTHNHKICVGSSCTSTSHSDLTWEAWGDATTLPTSGRYYLTTDVTLSKATELTGDLTLCLNGKTIHSADKEELFSAITGSSRTVNLTDCDGRGMITGFDSSTGGAVNCKNFYMFGGTISGNTATSNGGAVNCKNFYMFGGTISGNRATGHGGAVMCSENFSMYGGTISDNHAGVEDETTSHGGGVYNYDGFSGYDLAMYGGTISGNTATGHGGGAYFKNRIFTMKSGTISGNTANGNGGGVYVQCKDPTCIADSTISDNTANGHGGGVYMANSGELEMTKVDISGNTAEKGGGMYTNVKTTLNSGTISRNTAKSNGGGVYSGGHTELTGTAAITENVAKGNGGGVYSCNQWKMTGGTISGNTATGDCGETDEDEVTGYGGGVYNKSKLFFMYSGTISGNTAAGYGGGIASHVTRGRITLGQTPKITGNKPTNLHWNDFITVDSTITDGAEIYVYKGSYGDISNPGATGVDLNASAKYFHSDTKGYEIIVQNNKLHLAESPKYDINLTVPDGAHGTATLEPASAAEGVTVTVKTDPEEEYRAKVTASDKEGNPIPVKVSSDNPDFFTFDMAGDGTSVSVSFEEAYTITLPAETSNGTVTVLPAKATEDETVIVTATPTNSSTHKAVVRVTYSEGNIMKNVAVTAGEKENTYTFTMPDQNVAVSVEFKEVFAITAPPASENGLVEISTNNEVAGEPVTVKAIPNDGYKAKVTITDNQGNAMNVPVTPGEDNTYTFTMPDQAVMVSVTFVKAATKIILPETYTIYTTDEGKILTPTFEPSGVSETVTWSSSNTDVLEVDASTGVLTPKKAGTAVITAAAGQLSATCTVTVLELHVHCICGSTTSCGENHDPDQIWEPWDGTRDGNAVNFDGGYYYLTDEFPWDCENWTANDHVYICINGHTAESQLPRIYSINLTGTFTLTTCYSSVPLKRNVNLNASSVLNLYNVQVDGNGTTNEDEVISLVAPGATLNMHSGTAPSCYVSGSSSEFNMCGGNVTTVEMQSDSVFTMSGGMVLNVELSGYANRPPVPTFNMSGGEISGKVDASDSVTINISGGKIANLSLPEDYIFSVTGNPTDIGITTVTKPKGDKRVVIATSDNDTSGYFHSIDPGYVIDFEDDTLYLRVEIPATSVKLNTNTLSLDVDQEYQLTASVEPGNADVTWSSSNTDVATVDQNGNVTAVGVGEAIITAKSGQISAACTVTVKAPHMHCICGSTTSCGENHNPNQIWKPWDGQSTPTSQYVYLENGVQQVNKLSVQGNEAISLCLNNCSVTANGGQAFYIRNNGKLILTDCGENGSISGSYNECSLVQNFGEFQMFRGTVSFKNGTNVMNESSGTFYLKGGKIRVESDEYEESIGVYNNGTFDMSGGAISGTNTYDIGIVSFGGNSELRLSGGPVITGEFADVSLGNGAKVTVGQISSGTSFSVGSYSRQYPYTICDGDYSEYFTSAKDGYFVDYDEGNGVTVLRERVAVESVSLNKNSVELTFGGTATLEANVQPTNAFDKTVTWISSDKAVATVDQNGKVTAVGVGEAIITATAGQINATCTVTVVQMPVAEPTVSGKYTYTGEEQTVTLTGFDETYMTVVSGNTGTKAGNYEAVVTLNSNYKWENGSDGNIQWTIGEAKLTGVSVTQTGEALIYTGEPLTPVVTTAATAVDGQNVTFTYRATENENFGTMPTFTNAGTYTVYYEATAECHSDVTGFFTVNVGKQSVALPSIADKVYTGSVLTATVPASDLYTVTENAGGTKVGTYNVKLQLVDADNYTWPDSTAAEVTLPFKITKADAIMTVPAAISNLVYDGNPKALVSEGSSEHGTFQYKLNDGGWGTAVPTAVNAGTYTVYWKFNGGDNHKDIDVTPVTVEIDRASIDPKVRITGWTYGDTANDPSVDVNPGNGTVVYYYRPVTTAPTDNSTDVPTAAGNYIVTAVIPETQNYEGAVATAEFTIAKRQITVTAEAKSKIYGEADPELTYTVTGLAGKDSLEGKLSRTEGQNVGTYTITLDTLKVAQAVAANYQNIEYTVAEFTINKKPLTVKAKDHTITYGEEPDNDGVTYEGFVTDEDETNLGGELTYTYTYKQYDNVGNSYEITPAGLTSSNYDITFVDGTLTVNQKSLTPTVILDPEFYTYDNTAKQPAVTVKDGNRVLPDSEYAVGYGDNTVVGVANVSVTNKDGGNYDVAPANVKFVILPDTSALEGLTVENVTSANQSAIDTVLNSMKKNDAYIDVTAASDAAEDAWNAIKDNAIALSDAIANAKTVSGSVAAETAKLPTDIKDVKTSDLAKIEKILRDFAAIEGNLTQAEQDNLADEIKALTEMKAAIDQTNEEIGDVTEQTDAFEKKDLVFDDKEDIEALKDQIADLKDNNPHLTDTDKNGLDALTERVEDLEAEFATADKVTDQLNALNTKAEPDDGNAVAAYEDAKKAYAELSDADKAKVDPAALEHLADMKAALTAYKIIKGDGTKHQLGSSQGLTIVSNGYYPHFRYVKVNDREISSSNYTSASGSTIVTLKPEYVNRLMTGKYTITIGFGDEDYIGEATANVQLYTDSGLPFTGDTIAMWVAILVISGGTLVAVLVFAKKKFSSKK